MHKPSSIKGHFDGHSVVLDEPAALTVGQSVRIIVDSNLPDDTARRHQQSLAGFAKGMFEVRDDFDDPLNEFSEYR